MLVRNMPDREGRREGLSKAKIRLSNLAASTINRRGNMGNPLYTEIDRLREQNRELLEALKKAAARPLEVRAIMESNDLKIDNLADPYQKLALTFYTIIVETATESEDLIAKVGK